MDTVNLTLLARAVDAAIAVELGEPIDNAQLTELGVASRRTRQVAGSTVVSNAARDTRVDATAAHATDQMLRYRADRHLLLSKLQRANVAPDAIMPLAVLDAVCDKTHQLRCVPRGDIVRFAATDILKDAATLAWTDAKGETGDAKFRAWLILVSVVIVTGLLGHFVHVGGYIAMGLIGFFGLFGVGAIETTKNKNVEAKYVRERVEECEKKGTLVRQLWPNLREPDKGIDIRIDFTAPPTDIQQRLVALEHTHLPIHVAIGKDVIVFKESVADVLTGVWTATPTAVDRSLTPVRMPFAYVVEGLAAAIVQYGPFPVDPEVIDEIVNTMPLV